MNEELLFLLKQNTNWNTNLVTSVERIGGLNNNNYKISYNGNDFFIRICTNLYLDNDRKTEFQIINKASNIDLTPKPYYFSIKSGNMILPWIKGKMPTEDEFSSINFINKLTKRLKELHNLNCEKLFKPFNHIKTRIDLCKKFNISLPNYIDTLFKKLNYLEFILNNNPTIGLCHNDLNCSNILLSKNNLYFIDYEYSAMGDVFWDLATISWFLNDNCRKNLLIQYFGYYKEEDYKKLLDFLYVVKFYNATWSLLKTKDPNNDYDYLNGANIIFEDLRQNS
ncbi:choline kinase family protein [Clostridium sp. ZBS2]|uniref:choline kinase family protein n=1 Tax=Clostridium sp. ZBS2 TaxID=2949976 RepID=UPI0020792937|nr:choline kinase family protein [Clostridium sp. ZBS2]